MKIRTDHKWKPFVYRYDVPTKVLSDWFDYQDPEESYDGFFQYRGHWYHLDQFMRIDKESPLALIGDWHGYASDSFFSGVLIRVSEDGGEYQIGTYIS